jgi:ketosteroid isomerase-like protein
MKFIMSFVAVVALSFVTAAFAQEESPSATPEESATPAEKASATVEDKPSATATAGESKTEKKTEVTATAEKKDTTAASSATKSASPAASTSGKKMSTEATLRDNENKWEAAYAAHDVSVVESFVASDFVGVSPKYKFTSRSSMISDFKKDKDTYTSAKNETLKVAMFGPNVAVVNGRAREKGTGKDGKTFDRTYYFTDTWMLRNGKWQCIASQASEVKK